MRISNLFLPVPVIMMTCTIENMSSSIPEEVWHRWSTPEYDSLRQAVLVFGGSIRKEAAIELFPEVSLLYQEGEGTNTIKGTFYLTTKRMIFLPKNQIPHPLLVMATFDSLRCLSGVRSDLTITIIDNTSASANFQFQSTKSLFQCFNLLRSLSEASRFDANKFRRVIARVASESNRDETPFSSIEVELQECHQNLEVPEALPVDPIVAEENSLDPLGSFLAPIKFILDYCNHLHFDIHIKLRTLFFVSLISFFLKFIPFLPLVALCVIIYLLFSAWQKLNLDNNKPQEPRSQSEGFLQVRQFFTEWFAWENSEKSMLLLKSASAIFLGWIILPPNAYVLACIVSYLYFIVLPIYQSNIFSKIVSGFWFCT